MEYITAEGKYADRAQFPPPQVVVLDVKMPKMSGLEALAWIRSRRDLDAIPIVMFTSSTQESDVDFSRRHGANAYLVKPSNADQLSVLVQRVLHATRAVTPESPRLAMEGNAI